jgi:hypothetical protein
MKTGSNPFGQLPHEGEVLPVLFLVRVVVEVEEEEGD